MSMTPQFREMAVSLKATAAGQNYNLNDRQGIFLDMYDLGLPSTERLSQRSPGQQGDTDLGGITAPRFLDLSWTIQGKSLNEYRALRDKIMTVFRNEETAVTLTFDFGDGRVRATDVHLDGALDFRNRRHTMEQVGGVFKASDPRLYDPTLHTATFALLDSSGGLPIPFTIPIPIGQDALSSIETITYASGSRLASIEYPLIIITGPIDNPVITNLTTNEKISLTANGGLSLSAGQFVTIDLSGFPRRDNKTMRDQDENGVSQYLSTDSDLATWHLSYNGELLNDGTYSDGTNDINCTGSNINLNTQVEIRYYDRYEGA